MLHLLPPTLAWVGVASLVHGSVPVLPTAAVALPMSSAVVLAWFRYPKPFVRRLDLPSGSRVITLALTAAVLWTVIWFAGRPVGEENRAGVLWGQPQAFNNIRAWIDARTVVGAAPVVEGESVEGRNGGGAG